MPEAVLAWHISIHQAHLRPVCIKLRRQQCSTRSRFRRLLGSQRLNNAAAIVMLKEVIWHSMREVELAFTVVYMTDSFGLHFGQHPDNTQAGILKIT